MSEENPTPIEIRDEFRSTYWELASKFQALETVMSGVVALLVEDIARRDDTVDLVATSDAIRRMLLTHVEAEVVRCDGLPEGVKRLEQEEKSHRMMIGAARKFLSVP